MSALAEDMSNYDSLTAAMSVAELGAFDAAHEVEPTPIYAFKRAGDAQLYANAVWATNPTFAALFSAAKLLPPELPVNENGNEACAICDRFGCDSCPATASRPEGDPYAIPVPWFHTDNRASDLPAHMQQWQDEARGERA